MSAKRYHTVLVTTLAFRRDNALLVQRIVADHCLPQYSSVVSVVNSLLDSSSTLLPLFRLPTGEGGGRSGVGRGVLIYVITNLQFPEFEWYSRDKTAVICKHVPS